MERRSAGWCGEGVTGGNTAGDERADVTEPLEGNGGRVMGPADGEGGR